MSLVIKKHKNENYYISMSYEDNLIVVQVCPIVNDDFCTCGYPIKKMTYTPNDKRNANATFNRYIKNYT